MKHMPSSIVKISSLILASILLTNCGGPDDVRDDHAHDHAAEQIPTNRIAIPSTVRSNLGITFATAERRQIDSILRAPGRFEYLPTALREYRTPVSGRVELLVNQFDAIQENDILYRMDSPAWRDLQKTIAQSASELASSQAIMDSYPQLFAAHKRHERSLQEALSIWMGRVEKLEALREAGGGRMTEYTAALAEQMKIESELAEVQEEDVKLSAARTRTKASLEAAQAQYDLALDTAASFLNMTREELVQPVSKAANALPVWRNISMIEVRSVADGIVQSIDLTNGTWADEQSNVMTIVQPDRLRFHATGLQSDLGILRDGLKVMIVPPAPTSAGSSIPMEDIMTGELKLGLDADPDNRTVDLHVVPDQLESWARAGVSAQLEIVTDSTELSELAIPLAAVQRDGLVPVIFRRAPDNPNEAIRMEADLGTDDGRWVAILSGLRDGDEVVLDGGFQLMLATSGTIQQGGHFHADGTFHEGEH